ncbi:MAG: Rid family hydrolase [Candidatus Omnitrophica bacterium]|nr:Rid family hydrolase [Candidatus Omnitrophota bacterium]
MGLKRMLSNKENALAGKLEKMLIAALLSYRDRQSTDTQSKISKDRIKFFAHIMARGLYQMDNTMLVERGAWKVLPPDVREIILSRSKVDKAIIDDVLAPKLFALLIEYVEKKLTARQAAFFAQRLIPYEVAKKLSKDESITEADAVKFIMYYSTGVAEAVRLYKERLAKMKKEFSKELARGKLSLDEIDFFAYSYKENTADAIRGFLDKIEELKNIFKAELESGLVTMYLLRSFSRRGRLVDAEGFVRNYLKSVETEAAKNTISPGTVHYTVFNNQDAAAAVAAFRRDVDELKIKFAGEINSGVLLRSEIIRIRRAHPKLATAEEAIRIFLSNVKLLTEKYAAQLNKSKKERELVPSVMRRFAFNSPEDPVSAIDDYLEKVNGLKAQYAQEIKDGRMSLRTIADIVAHFSENAEQKINKFLRKHPAKNSVIPQATNGIQLGKARVPYEHILLSAVPVEGKTLEVQMNNLLSNVDKALKEKGCDRNSVFKQAVFLKNLADKDKCREIMGEHYGRAPPPATSYIIQAPANGELLSIEVMAIPKSSTASIERVDGNVTIVKDSGIKWAYISGLEPDSDIKDTYKQAADVFARMRKTLADHGFKFENILRTWIYQGHITDKDDDGQQRYDKMNEARWNLFKTGDAGNEIKFLEAFIRRQLPEGVFPYPASTGIDMNNGSFVMECVAISTDRNDIEVFPIENPRQTSVYKYEKKELFGKKINPLFSRGMAFVMGNSQCIFVSGTASIIKGLSIGSDAAVQTEEAIENVRLVLNEAGAGLKDIAQLRVYVKYQSDYEKVKRILDAKFDKTPRIDVIAGVCRQDLLVEIEAIAYTKAAERPKPLPDTKKIELRSLTTPSDVPRPALKPTRKTATAQAAAVVDGKTKEPIVFLRKIVDTKELTQNMIEGILSALFSNKKPTFAFSRKLKGLELEQLSLLVEQLNKWKEATAKKNPKMKKLLDNFTVFTYDDLTIELGTRGIDVNDKDGLIFTYEPQPKEETGKLGSAIRRVYITEPEKGFPTEYYYPLLEMVTVSVAKELLGWDEQQLKDAMVDSGITIDVFGIEPYIDDKTGILIFNILPKMELYDNSSRINRYTRLLQFLRAA